MDVERPKADPVEIGANRIWESCIGECATSAKNEVAQTIADFTPAKDAFIRGGDAARSLKKIEQPAGYADFRIPAFLKDK